MNNTWIKLYRKSLNSSVFTNPITWKVWCWCLMKTNYQRSKIQFNGTDLIIKQGQFITGRSKAIEELDKISEQSYRTAIKYLKSTNRITTKSTNKFTIITIINWEQYQSKKNNLTSKKTNKLTNEQPATNQPLTTYNNDNNDKNIYNSNFKINKMEKLGDILKSIDKY